MTLKAVTVIVVFLSREHLPSIRTSAFKASSDRTKSFIYYIRLFQRPGIDVSAGSGTGRGVLIVKLAL